MKWYERRAGCGLRDVVVCKESDIGVLEVIITCAPLDMPNVVPKTWIKSHVTDKELTNCRTNTCRGRLRYKPSVFHITLEHINRDLYIYISFEIIKWSIVMLTVLFFRHFPPKQHGYSVFYVLYITHWGGMTHICVCKLTIIGSDYDLSHGRCQAII